MSAATARARLISDFHCRLDRDEQEAAIRQMADDGFGDHAISEVTGLHVEIIRRVLSKPRLETYPNRALEWHAN